MEQYIPDIYQKSIHTIDYDKLLERGIKCLLFDLDNTIVPVSIKEPNKKISDLFNELKKKGFNIYIFSNSHKKRVREFADVLEVNYNSSSKKPLKKSFLKVISANNYNVSEVAIIGDQLLTDILGGNKVGITTILVNPISTKDFFFTRFLRAYERKIMKDLRDNNLFVQGRYYE